MLAADLLRLYPRLFHMAEDGSWPSIQRHGLLATSFLLDAWNVDEETRRQLVSEVRRGSVSIAHGERGTAVIRDQKPINLAALAEALTDMTTSEWLEHLNARTFFFLQYERLSTLLRARSYRGRPHLVLTVDTESLYRAHGKQIELCKINSGFAQPHSKAARGRATFRSISEYPHPTRETARVGAGRWDVAELCVVGGVPDIVDHVLRVDRMQGDVLLERIFER